MIKNNWILTITGFFLLGALLSYVFTVVGNENMDSPVNSGNSTTTQTQNPYGKVTLKVGQTAIFADNSIKLVRIFDESRCPTDVTCVWAGTVKVEIISVSALGSATATILLNKTFTTEAEKITFLEATPYPKTGTQIQQGDYQVTFEVIKRKSNPISSTGKCYVGGCSSQICSDKEGVVSNCLYQESYACYKTATCERQKSGECGWTNTASLQGCLSKGNTQ